MEFVGVAVVSLLLAAMILKKSLPSVKACLTTSRSPTPKEPW